MCNFFSIVLTEKKAYAGPDNSHREILDYWAIADSSPEKPDFVKYEVRPPDRNLSAPYEKWKVNVDQDRLPAWYCPETDRARALEFVRQVDPKAAALDYNEAITRATRAYSEAEGPATRTHNEAVDAASRAYDAAVNAASRAYDGAEGPASRAHSAAVTQASQAYNEAVTQASRAHGEAVTQATRTYKAAIGQAKRAYSEAITRSIDL